MACGGQSPAPAPEKLTPDKLPPPAETSADAAGARPAKKTAKSAPGPRTFADELAATDKAIAANLARAEKQPSSWLILEQVANKHLARARLSGDWNDYARAEELLEKAFAIPKNGGPLLTRAHLNYTLHRLDRAAADIEQAETLQIRTMNLSAKAGLQVFHGDLAFQRGDYKEARSRYEQALKMVPGHTGALTAKATFAWKTGDFDAAEAAYDEAESKYHGRSGEPKAWYDLMRGLMDLDRGRYDDALAHYRLAEQDLAGWWLVDEHVAEILTLTGKTEEAKALYLDIIERTGNPEFMDAMAGILREEGKTAEADEYIAKARAKFEEQLAQYPEAAYGHALGHFLEFGDDPEKTLELARKNYALRPNGEAATLLAQALLKAGKASEAKIVVGKTLATMWNTADLHATAADVYDALGDGKRAASEREKALAINPKALE